MFCPALPDECDTFAGNGSVSAVCGSSGRPAGLVPSGRRIPRCSCRARSRFRAVLDGSHCTPEAYVSYETKLPPSGATGDLAYPGLDHPTLKTILKKRACHEKFIVRDCRKR
jgi:hypothetical protein